MDVVATAGHVDHGKSTLVRALTGMEPDRWAEERRRGMTIDLGFVWTALPSGRDVAFVDVPGHARFVANMLAGIGPVPATLFVVAADEGWQPQSTEHLAALDALGVRHGLLAVTRADLGDAELALAEAREHLAGSTLADAPAVAVSAVSGQGLDELRATLDALLAGLPPPDPDADVRLWVDRAFTIKGAGTVVTGTLGAGRISAGDELEVAPGGARVRVRGVQTLRRSVPTVLPTARVAVNLRGVSVEDVPRGHALVTPGRWLCADEIDVRLAAPAGELPAEPLLHVGSAAVSARVRELGPGLARLRLAGALPLRPGDRALLRDPGRHLILAGVDVLDVRPPGLRRRGAVRARAAELASAPARPDADAEVTRRGIVRRRDLLAFGAGEPGGSAVRVGEYFVAAPRWAAAAEALRAVVDRHAASHPLEAGIPVEAARRELGLPDPRLVEALAAADGQLESAAGRVRRRGTGSALPAELERPLATLSRRLQAEPFAAPEAGELAGLGLTPPLIAAACRAGRLLRVADGVVLLPEAEEEAVRRLAALPQPFTASQARQALGSTRRVVIPLLEWLDARGRTRRRDGATREVVNR